MAFMAKSIASEDESVPYGPSSKSIDMGLDMSCLNGIPVLLTKI